jgi:hypothetical protein
MRSVVLWIIRSNAPSCGSWINISEPAFQAANQGEKPRNLTTHVPSGEDRHRPITTAEGAGDPLQISRGQAPVKFVHLSRLRTWINNSCAFRESPRSTMQQSPPP